TDLINRYALGYPHIRFEFYHNGKIVFKTTGSNNKLQVLSQIYGVEVAKNAVHTKTSTLDFDIEGFFIKPEITRSNRRYVTLIVNGRYVRNYPLTQAIIAGYGTLLPIHRFPIAIVYIELDPILIDVNVHPTKLEVRFSKEKELAKTIETLVRNTFKKESLIPKIAPSTRDKRPTEQGSFSLQMPDRTNPRERQQVEENHHVHHSYGTANEKDIETINIDSEAAATFLQTEEFEASEKAPEISNVQLNPDNFHIEKTDRIPMMYPIGQLQGTYILAQNEQGFYMIDQHAAQERIKYEFFKKQLGKPVEDEQQLLIPLQFDFTPDELILLEQFTEELASVGVVLEHFGGQTYTVRSHPTWFPKGEEEQIIRDIINQVIEEGAV